MKLKAIRHYEDTNTVEATWVRIDKRIVSDVDAETGQAISIEQTVETPVRCHSYSADQMDMLAADLGADAANHGELMASVRKVGRKDKKL